MQASFESNTRCEKEKERIRTEAPLRLTMPPCGATKDAVVVLRSELGARN